MESILSFTGENFFLSNFFSQPLEFDGRSYLNSEAAYQSMKVMYFETRNQFSNLDPDAAKKLGRELMDRTDWHDVKIKIMQQVLEAKFKRIPEMASKLLGTGIAILVEGNDWCDNFWGDCTCDKCKDIVGENHLGRLLMNLRQAMILHAWDETVEKRAYERVIGPGKSTTRLLQPTPMDPEVFKEKMEEMIAMVKEIEDRMYWGDPEKNYFCFIHSQLYTRLIADHKEIFDYIQALRNVAIHVSNHVPEEHMFFVLDEDKIIVDSVPYQPSFSAKVVNASEYGEIGGMTAFFKDRNRAMRREAKFNQKPNKESMVNPHGNKFSKTSYKGRVYS